MGVGPTMMAGGDAAWGWLDAELAGRPAPPLVVLMGVGDGAALDAIEARAPGVRVLALEPDAAAAAVFASSRRCGTWRAAGRLAYLVDPDYAGADDAWRIFPSSGDAPPVLINPALRMSAGIGRAARALKQILFGVNANRQARRRFAPPYLLNTIRNVPALSTGRDLRALAGACRGVPAVIAGAGPSLDAALPDLRTAGSRALLISVDTALRPLLMAGLVPALVVGLDPGVANLRHFLELPECRDTWLVAESALHHDATARFDGRTFWFRAAEHHPWPWLKAQGLDAATLDVWGSVLTAAFQVACLAGCDPIVFAGADLACTGGQPYARGTTYEFDWAANAARGIPLEESWREQIARTETTDAAGVQGQPVATTGSMVSVRDWIVARARRSGRRVFNASGAGILYGEGIEQGALADILRDNVRLPALASLGRRPSRVEPAALAVSLRAVRRSLDRDPDHGTPIAEWREFSGEGFDAAALSAALDEAATALEAGRRRAPVRAALDWSALARCLAPYGTSAIGDGVARYRDALGAPPSSAQASADDAHIDEALRLAGAIGRSILRLPRLSPARSIVPATDVPASVAYEWPEPLRWAILAFEASMGHLEWPGTGDRTSAFVDGAVDLRPVAGVAAPSDVERALALLDLHLSLWFDGDPDSVAVAHSSVHSEPAHARRLTGCARVPPTPHRSSAGVTIGRVPVLRRPRVLTDAGVRRASVAYATSRGVVCVVPHTCESLLVRADGAIEPHNVWPRPITGELPFGSAGAVAWSNGLSAMPSVEPAYVMYRCHADSEVAIQELPIRPALGTWWNERLYWCCLPTAEGGWHGLASWNAGEEPALELPGVMLFGMRGDGDRLRLDPSVVGPAGGYVRALLTEGWTWRPGDAPTPLALSAEGSVSSRAGANGWTAGAYPAADLIRLQDDDGRRVDMTCYYPLRLAWTGRSLLVSTGDRELLLFDELPAALRRAAATEG